MPKKFTPISHREILQVTSPDFVAQVYETESFVEARSAEEMNAVSGGDDVVFHPLGGKQSLSCPPDDGVMATRRNSLRRRGVVGSHLVRDQTLKTE